MQAHSGEGVAEGGSGYVNPWTGWRWHLGEEDVDMRRRWRRKKLVGAGSWQLMTVQRKRVLPGSYCPPWEMAAGVEFG